MSSTTQTPSDRAGRLAGSWRVDAAESRARFTARTMAGLVRVPGHFPIVAGSMSLDERGASGTLALDAASIETGNSLRDRHLRSRAFFRAAKHPELRYEVDSVEVEGATVKIDGRLLVAGTRTRLPLGAELRHRSDGAVEIVCNTQVDRLELGIRGARGMVPRLVDLDVAVVLRRAR